MFGGVGGAGGAAGGIGKELVTEGGEGFGPTLTGGAGWFTFSLCAREADEFAGLPPKLDLGAVAGALANGCGAEFGPEL